MFLMNYPSEEKDIPLKADSDPARLDHTHPSPSLLLSLATVILFVCVCVCVNRDVWIKMIQDAKHEYLKTKRRSEQEIKKKCKKDSVCGGEGLK